MRQVDCQVPRKCTVNCIFDLNGKYISLLKTSLSNYWIFLQIPDWKKDSVSSLKYIYNFCFVLQLRIKVRRCVADPVPFSMKHHVHCPSRATFCLQWFLSKLHNSSAFLAAIIAQKIPLESSPLYKVNLLREKQKSFSYTYTASISKADSYTLPVDNVECL